MGEALNGTVNPSGHLVDTWAVDPAGSPAAANLGDYTITNSNVTSGNKYIVYAEGIYVAIATMRRAMRTPFSARAMRAITTTTPRSSIRSATA